MGRKKKKDIIVKGEIQNDENLIDEEVDDRLQANDKTEKNKSKKEEPNEDKARKEKVNKWKSKTAEKYGTHVMISKAYQIIRAEDVIPTGIASLDYALGVGGVTGGRIYEIFGDPSTGKTVLTYHVIGKYQKAGKYCLFIDGERTFDPLFAGVFGVDVDDDTFLEPIQPESTEQTFEILEDAVNERVVDLIIVDSVSSLTPNEIVIGKRKIDNMTAAYKAQIFGRHLEKFVPIMSRARASIMFINHTYDPIGDPHAKYKEPPTKCGKELKYHGDTRIEIQSRGRLVNKEGDDIGAKILYKIRKNKMAYGGRKSQVVWLNWGLGFRERRDLVLTAKHLNIIQGQAWYSCPELFGDDWKMHGEKGLIKYFYDDNNNKGLKKLKKKVYEEIQNKRKLNKELFEEDEEKNKPQKKKK